MSQAKVDKKKYEKHHRKEIEKKKKRETILAAVITVVVISALIGVPAGYKISKTIPTTIESSYLGDYVKYCMSQEEGYPFINDADLKTSDTEEPASEDGTSTEAATDTSTEDAGTTEAATQAAE